VNTDPRRNDHEALDDELELDERPGPRKKRGEKILKVLGGEAPMEYIKQQNQDLTPWYLRPVHGPNEILVNPDGGVRGGTLPALIERLTMHDMRDATFIDTFLMTFRSFSTANEVFELLVQRFNIHPPEGMTPEEHKTWVERKQKPIMVRVINIFKSMATDSGLEEEPEILDKIREFASSVINVAPVSKTLILVVDRAKKGDTIKMTATTTEPPPPSYIPRRGKLKLLEIEPLELARQLTILESRLYLKITPTECLERGRDSSDRVDNIKNIITTANKLAEWVAESILSKEDPRRRANIIKHFIVVAERCRHLNNFSSMAALIAGLNTPPIRRLKRSWEQVNTRTIAVLEDVERTLDSGKNFNGYRQMLAKVDPPCVPFLGVYLTILVFINDGNKDILAKEGNLINFNKRQKAAEIIREIKKYQSKPYNLAPVESIQSFLRESLAIDRSSDYFWQLSLEREPREREDEKMARLLQESGFL
jgi:son of sevenless-like protein